ncbi:uncharacterized protein LOC129928640 [Biomphalaria glabrata]|uniref:Uncharacterized protein LOC129928640 n=1 Tax=Biomphalaria glabrata TaxID=6526 RepID=A0A9W3BJL0_BIOGL|nr:uncharacterized protein LOC129928640 [Biomphalaria glabrata]
MQCRDFLKTTASKVLEKSLIKYKLVRSMKWLQPKAIVTDHVSCLKQLEITLNCLSTLGRVDENKCDTIKAQYRQWYNQIISNSSVDFQSFDSSFQRLDVFFKDHLGRQSEFKDLWTVVRFLLMLSHGQAQVERGFSVNKEVMSTNMAEKTLVAKRTISDFIDFSGGIDNIIVTKQMLMAARASREKYRHHLDQLAEEKKKDGLKRKREEDFGELDNLKQKKNALR